MRRLVAPLAVALAAAAAACAEVGTDPTEPFSIQFSGLPSPAILVGDTLRDLEGNPADLRTAVRVFNAANEEIDVPITVIATNDSARVRWDATTGYVVSFDTTSRTTVGIQVTAGSLVPPAQTLAIVRVAPDSIADADTGSTQMIFVDNVAATTARALQARLRADTALLSSWPVQFRVVTLPPSLDSVRFIASPSDSLRSAPFDTTSAGIASRFVRGWVKPTAPDGTDTLVVEAVYRVRREVTGSVRFRVLVGVNRTP